jgi:sterol desaturase/sphingolipid hydroxylase (fatty acid hydroxylase superfamily)
MTMWSDNRNHLLDDIIRDTLLVVLSQIIGIPPGQFIAIVVFTQLVETFSHANVRMSFGLLGQRLLVGPKFHRKHHSIHYDASAPGPKGGYNFAVLFPVWDMLFRTARYDGDYEPTGIHDQLPQNGHRDYGRGILSQHWLALKRMVGGHQAGFPPEPGAQENPGRQG